ncbi:MAG TPA: glycosyltransferase family 2 protein [Gemmatimonadaceae bacterium]|nr:glycosyltransferase family 2 protein [Gemmatimonadaceae bacterium]
MTIELRNQTGSAPALARAPRVSIGVPAYNAARYLALTLDSLVRQTYTDVEIIVCDNASSDATSDIASDFARRDPRVRHVRSPENVGAGRNFIRCAQLARGELFRWASADDLSAPTFVERCVEALDAHADVVQAFPRTTLIDENGVVLKQIDDPVATMSDSPRERYMHVMRNLTLVNSLYGVMRTATLRRTAIHGTYVGADLVVQAELALYGKIVQVPEYLFFRRMHAQAHSAMTREQQLAFHQPAARARRLEFTRWRQLAERLRTVLRSSISARDKALLAMMVAREGVKSRDELFGELYEVMHDRFAEGEGHADGRG